MRLLHQLGSSRVAVQHSEPCDAFYVLGGKRNSVRGMYLRYKYALDCCLLGSGNCQSCCAKTLGRPTTAREGLRCITGSTRGTIIIAQELHGLGHSTAFWGHCAFLEPHECQNISRGTFAHHQRGLRGHGARDIDDERCFQKHLGSNTRQ